MILTGSEIERERLNGRITIEPFVPEQINPNSYNFRLGDTLRVYGTDLLDVRQPNAYEEVKIPPDGFVLEPGHLYLAHTVERLGSDHYVPTFAARSSIARLGLFINLSASLGDIGYTGQWTLQLYTMNRIRVYAGVNIGQMMWWKPTGRIELYDGKYQGAAGPRSSDIHIDIDKQFARQRLPGLRSSVEVAEVGPKFAALAVGSRDFPVPSAFCVPAGELRAALDEELSRGLADAFADLQATVGAFFTETIARIREIAARVRMPDDLRSLVCTRLAEVFGGRAGGDGNGASGQVGEGMLFAVRSSGIDEDTDHSSLAGVHESVLGVSGPDGVIAAIEECWRSWYAAPAVAARVRRGDLDWRPRLGVIVQEQVRPRLAGVAFSAPARETAEGNRGDGDDRPCDVVIEYVEGLADRLVAGLEVPVRVTSGELGTATATGPGSPAYRDDLVGVVDLARRLRESHEHEVDVEWAIDDRGLHLIQVRPITAAGDRAEESDAPALRAVRLYHDDVPPDFGLGEVAGVYGGYVAKRGGAYRLAAENGIATGPGWVLRLNPRALRDAETLARLTGILAEGPAGECVIDAGDRLRQIVVPKAEVPDRLAQILGSEGRGTRPHTVIVRDFIRGELGLITRLAGPSLVAEYTPDGLMALNRGTAGAAVIRVADRDRPAEVPGNMTVSRDDTWSAALVPHLGRLAEFTDTMRARHGEVTLEWVFAGGQVYFVDYSVVGANRLTISAAGSVLISGGTARGTLLRLTEDDLLTRLSIGPAVSIDKSTDVSEHDRFARIVEKVTSLPEPPIIQASRPYAVLSVLIGHVAGFVFDQGSTLGHLPILLREARVPAVEAADFTGVGEVVISDGTITLVGQNGERS